MPSVTYSFVIKSRRARRSDTSPATFTRTAAVSPGLSSARGTVWVRSRYSFGRNITSSRTVRMPAASNALSRAGPMPLIWEREMSMLCYSWLVAVN